MKAFSLIPLLFTASGLVAAPVTFTSPIQQTSLIELYTSEGCSSCPPAERRLNELENHPGLWTDFVPIAFHVDYWDYIGWPDRFAVPAYTTRQKNYSKHWNCRTVYTPCFVNNGKAVRSLHPKPGNGKPGKLKATVDGSIVHIQFSPDFQPSGKMTVWIAPLSGMEMTKVRSGENRGRTLKHCFVALDLKQSTLQPAETGMAAEIKLDGTLTPKALAIWITNSHSMEPIQATGGWLAND
ncbi:DUF1223 domain-containing protein [Pontiellaceae bacterium B1224]|nr:DUF1223 domain-containing protein [Pontiellaceae bacterium B1224]